MKIEKLATVKLPEVLTFTTMSKVELDALLSDGVKVSLQITKPDGEEVTLELVGGIQPDEIKFHDEDGIEIHEDDVVVRGVRK